MEQGRSHIHQVAIAKSLGLRGWVRLGGWQVSVACAHKYQMLRVLLAYMCVCVYHGWLLFCSSVEINSSYVRTSQKCMLVKGDDFLSLFLEMPR